MHIMPKGKPGAPLQGRELISLAQKLARDAERHAIYPLTYEKIVLLENQLRHLRLEIEARQRNASTPGSEGKQPK